MNLVGAGMVSMVVGEAKCIVAVDVLFFSDSEKMSGSLI